MDRLQGWLLRVLGASRPIDSFPCLRGKVRACPGPDPGMGVVFLSGAPTPALPRRPGRENGKATKRPNDQMSTVIFFANTEWYLYNFRSALMTAARETGWGVRCVSPPGPFGEKLQAAGFEWDALPFERDSRLGMLFSLWRSRDALRRLIAETRPAIIHSFTLTSILITWLAVGRRSEVHRVNAVTGLGYAFTGTSMAHRLVQAVLRPFIRRALADGNAVTVVQNPTDMDFLVEHFGLDCSRVRLIPSSGVDIERFRPKARDASDKLGIGFVGRLLEDKGIREFVAAAREIRDRHPEIQFVVAGAPDLGNPAAVGEAELAAWRSENLVEFAGQVADMPEFLNRLDLFVLPSYREGLSRSLIEAGACGLPAVTTDVPGCRDVIADGDNGLLVPARDAAALSDAIERLVADAAMRKRMGERAREVVAERFSNEVVNAATLALYEERLAG